MALRKKFTAAEDANEQAAATQRPRRSAQPKKSYAPEPSGTDDSELDEDQTNVPSRRPPRLRSAAGRVADVAASARTSTRAGVAKSAAPSVKAASTAAAPAAAPQPGASGRRSKAAAAPKPQASESSDEGDDRDGAKAEEDREGEPEDEEPEDEEEDEEEDDEEQEQAGTALRATARAQSGGRRRGKQSLVPPTAVESRKRLFELLERRIGSVTGDGSGSGRRVLYGDLPLKNPTKKAKLMADLRSQFDDWHSRLRSNFSVLLYGFGSKRGLLDEFARLLAGPRNRGDAAVLVFHGYNPRCSARDVVTGVAGALMQRTFRNAGAAAGGGPALRALVEEVRQEPLDRHAFVVIHNLDGPGLRGDVSLISALAACPQVHLIASVDQALAPLLWDSADAARFRWQYINATTFQPYIAETSGAQSVLIGAFKSGVVTAGAGTVLRSLVLGAQEVFRVLAQYFIDDELCEGVAFAHLYRMCRERFLVRDEQVLRQHLVEFVDHQLVRVRAASDNSGELLSIPIETADLRAVLEDLDSSRKG